MVFFGMGEKVGFTNCVFEKKLCSSDNTIFVVFSANTAVAIKELYVEKTENYENSGSFLNMAKRCFVVCFSLGGGYVFVVCFLCVW